MPEAACGLRWWDRLALWALERVAREDTSWRNVPLAPSAETTVQELEALHRDVEASFRRARRELRHGAVTTTAAHGSGR